MDGNVDRSQLQPYNVLTESRTYESVMKGFFEWCDRDSSCAIHNKTLPSADLWEELIARADDSPIPVPACREPDSACKPTVSGTDILFNAQELALFQHLISGSPFLHAGSWPSLAEYLYEAYYHDNATALVTPLAANQPNGGGAFLPTAVGCIDWNISITTLEDVRYVQQMLNTTSPYTKGACENYNVMMHCLAWPIPTAYEQRVLNISYTSAPILMVNAYWDTETSYDWAVALRSEIRNATLLSRNGYGHTSYPLKGEAHRRIEEYLLNLTMPAPNTVVDS
jgi:hypothetical protein